MVLSGGLVVWGFCCLVVLLFGGLVAWCSCCLVVLLSGGLVAWCSCCLVVFWCCYFLVVCLEDSTEQSESNPGRSLGIKNKEGEAVWKTVPELYDC